jgi:sigma-B regulation protein RsbU (phosphoserine phosphatase)
MAKPGAENLRGRSQSYTVAYACLAALFVAAMGYQIALTRDIVRETRVDVPAVAPATASAILEQVSPAAEKAGLHPGDTLLAVNGTPYTGTSVLGRIVAGAEPGDVIALTVGNQLGVRTVSLPVTRGASSPSKIIYGLLLNVIMPLGSMLLGFWAVLVRPRDRLSWLLLGLLLSFSQLLDAHTIAGWPSGLREAAMAYHVGLETTWPAFMFLFGFFFPEPFPFWHKEGAWRRWVPWIVSAPLVLLAIAKVAVATDELTNYSAVQFLNRALAQCEGLLRLYAYCVVGFGFFTAIFTKSALAISPDARRRLSLLYWGTTTAMTPLLILGVVDWIRGKGAPEIFPEWLVSIAVLMLLIFPLTLAYVIVVQRAMDVRVVVRQGLQYGLAKSGILVLQFVAIAIVIGTALALASKSNLPEKMIVIGLAVTALFSIPRFGERLRTWTDRRFFREAYNAEQILSELSDQVRSMVETRSLIETVATRIADTLHIPNVAVLLGGSEPFRPAYALGFGQPLDVAFPPGAGTIKILRTQKEPARVYFDDPGSWLYRDPEVHERERAGLAELRAELLLPLSARDQLLGFISLGPKRSDEPYSGSDLRLLKSVAAQTGLALENARLMSAIADEVAQRERLNREIEIAREVQERLFPQTLPAVSGIEYAGACRPALGVGGDYYDFLALPGGRLGIAIGDVSGKGIAAALTMASLQASLRGEASRMTDDLAALVGNVNRLVFEASSSNRYATFFYGQFNPASRQLTYVNAGHNPPMLFHRSNGNWQVARLETGGTVVGLLETFPYVQATVNVAPGDIFIAFTDGISEAMNNADEEWGEERLIETIHGCNGLKPPEIITRVMQNADAFVAGAKQHDDMTLVVLHATAEPGQ